MRLFDKPPTQPLRNTQPVAAKLSPTRTGKLPVPTTTKLATSGPLTTTKLPTLIPATEKRVSIVPPKQVKRRRRVVLLSVLLTGAVLFILGSVFVAPLDNSQSNQGIIPTLNNIISGYSAGNSFAPAQHIATPTATPAQLTNEGYCGGADIWGTCATAVTQSGVMGTGQMQPPIASAVITQVFANPEYQLWCGCWRPHTGIDLATAYGTPVTAADSGQVVWVGWDWSGLGWAVKINHGRYIATIYGHMATYLVKVGDNVTQGQIIGREGSSGASTGPHLHFMVLVNNIWLDPTRYVSLP